jgi:hypothetical protein
MFAYYGPEWESLASRIVGRWCPSFSGATGLQLPDTMGQGHGVLTGMDRNTSWVNIGGQLAINNGGTGYADATNPALVNNARFTLAIWVSLNPPGGSGSFGIFTVGGTSTLSGPYEILYQNSGLTFFGTSGNGWCTIGTLPLGQWMHLVCVQNGTVAGSTSVFIDGVQITPASNITPTIVPFGTRTLIGLRRQGTGQANLTFDDAIFLKAALTPNEVRFLYDQGRGGGMLYQPPRRRSYFIAPVSGWKPYWIRPSSKIIGAGI